jgi:WS/DGAT/MGAT family acyltransferase
MVEGLEGGRWALVSKVHHSMVDGVASTDLMSVLFDASRDARLPEEVPWQPRREPSDPELLADALVGALTSPLTVLQSQRLPGLPPLLTPGEMLEAWRGFARSWSGLRPTPPSLNGPIGPHRRWSWAKGSLEEVKRIKGALGGTVNDVVLAAITAGFRELLLRRGEPVDGRVVRTLVPVSVRSASERGVFNNRVSGVFPELPVGIADPVERLEDIRRQMDGLKESRQAVAGDALTQLSGFAPPMWLALGSRLATRFPQRLVQTVTTNVPGPQQPLYVRGRQMLECYPYVPLGGQIRVGIAIFSYAGNLTFGVTGDYDTMPDVKVLCDGIRAGMDELARLARPRSGSAGRTRRARPRRAASGRGAAAATAAG